MTLGTRIKEHRTRAKLSQEKVAELVGVSRQAVTKWEADQSAPSTENLFRLAQILGTTVDALAAPEGNAPAPAAETQPAQKPKWPGNLRWGLITAAGYLPVYLLCKAFWTTGEDMTVLGWLFGTSPRHHEYLFGWLLHNRLYWYCALVSTVLAALGFRRTALTSLAGFTLALPLGEYLGDLPGLVPAGYHYGWAIWGLVYIGSILFGIWLQRLPAEALHFGSRKLRLWCVLAGVYLIAAVALVLLNIPPAYA